MAQTKYRVVIPTFNGGSLFSECLVALESAVDDMSRVVMIDSSSSDGTCIEAEKKKVCPIVIDKSEFNHGGTRNYGVLLCGQDTDVVVFLTQDAVIDDESSISNIVKFLEDNPDVGAVCGRQLPHIDATPLAMHARFFNYPPESSIKSIADISVFGIKTAFMSNSFSAYRVSALNSVGGFPCNTILCEDMFATAKMLNAGYKVGYCAEATVRHSHNYSALEEFKRYFDIGVFHASQPWIQEGFGGAGGEGFRYLKSEFSYLWSGNKLWLPLFLINNVAKILGLRLGRVFHFLPRSLVKTLSMHKGFWG